MIIEDEEVKRRAGETRNEKRESDRDEDRTVEEANKIKGIRVELCGAELEQ